jgi:hypothetical protein
VLDRKRFGRKISMPSTMEIGRDLLEMAHADTVVESFKSRGVTREEFATMMSGSVADNLLSQSGSDVTLRFERAGSETAADRVAR